MNLLARKAKERAEEAAAVHQVFVEVIRQQAAKQKKLGLLGSPWVTPGNPRVPRRSGRPRWTRQT
jgi:hypothetical protein